jgi:hypothetical protein
MNSGKHVLVLSFSGFDPKRAFGAALAALCNADPQIANVRSTGCVASQQTRPKKAGQ